FTPPPLPPLEALVPVVNKFVADLERENVFNLLLLRAFGTQGALLRTLALVLTVVLVLFVFYRFLHSRLRTEPRLPPLPARLDALIPQVPAAERRHQAALAQG